MRTSLTSSIVVGEISVYVVDFDFVYSGHVYGIK